MQTRFTDDGYVVLRQVLAADAVQQVRAYLAEQMVSTLDDLDGVIQTGHYPTPIRLDPVLWAIPRDRNLRDVLRVLLRSNYLYMHMPPMARFVLPGNTDAAVPAHQDATYNEWMGGFLTAWVPLVPIDDQCGGVAIYPGSGRALAHPAHQRDQFWRDAVSTEGLTPVVPHFDPGDVLIMDNHVIHASVPNRSDHPRISMDLRFWGEDGYSTKHYLDMQTWEVVAP